VAHALGARGLAGGIFARTHRRALAMGRIARHRAATVTWLRDAAAHRTGRQRAPSRTA
jgi:hypothetical protein